MKFVKIKIPVPAEVETDASIPGETVLGKLYAFISKITDTDISYSVDAAEEQLKGHVSRASRGRAAYLKGIVPHNKVDILWQTPIRSFYMLFSPFPSKITDIQDITGVLDSFLYIFLFIFFFKSMWLIREKNKALILAFFLILVTFCGPFAWGTSNYGTAIRHRQKIVFLLIIGASFSLAQIKQKQPKEKQV